MDKVDEEHIYKSSFFFTSFPKEFGAKEMYGECQVYGDIDEVVIPSKWDIRERCYDFVRFFDVRYEELLNTKLDNIFIGEIFLQIFQDFKEGTSKDLKAKLILGFIVNGWVGAWTRSR